jgi:hypothetical protein
MEEREKGATKVCEKCSKSVKSVVKECEKSVKRVVKWYSNGVSGRPVAAFCSMLQ